MWVLLKANAAHSISIFTTAYVSGLPDECTELMDGTSRALLRSHQESLLGGIESFFGEPGESNSTSAMVGENKWLLGMIRVVDHIR
jgi:hypothetical protein